MNAEKVNRGKNPKQGVRMKRETVLFGIPSSGPV